MSLRLKFTPVEELMLHHDSKAYPYTCFMRMQFEGRVNQAALELAARQALARHPLLSATIDESGRCPYWELEDEPTPQIKWREGEVDAPFPTAGFLDHAAGGLRILVTRSDSKSDVLLQFLHACCDGMGILQFSRDLILLYAAESGADVDASSLPRLETDRLGGRGTFGLTWAKLGKMARQQAVGLKGVRQFLMRSPTPLVSHDRVSIDGATSEPYPAACAWHFDVETSAAFRSAAKGLGSTTNDLLVRDLFTAIRQFRTAHNQGDDNQWLRMLVPFNLRNVSDRLLPAANVVSSIFLDRCGSEIADSDSLLDNVKQEMQLIKSHKLGYTFVFSLHATRFLPGGLRRSARADRCNASVVFTNLGRILARSPLPRQNGELICGDVRLENIEILAPMTRFTDVAFTATWYANRLSICLHYDPRPLTAEDAQALLNLFVGNITRSASPARQAAEV